MRKYEKYYIDRMLTVSTAHISKETATVLISICNGVKESELVVYPKKYKHDYYGWFICCSKSCIEEIELNNSNIPNDLFKLLDFTSDLNIDWICLDRDGEIIESEYLETYEW